MSDAVLDVEQAVQILLRFQEAAPASASRKLGRVIALLQQQERDLSQANEQTQRLKIELEQAKASSNFLIPSQTASGSAIRRTVTDQLADIFDLINTDEPDEAQANDALDIMIAQRSLEIPPAPISIEEDTAEFVPENIPSLVENDPMAWLREALPHLLLSEEEEEQVHETIRVVTARLKTTPIFDVAPLMQQTLRPTIALVRDHAERLRSKSLLCD